MSINASIKAYKFLFSLLLFLTPLLVVTNTNELYEFPKMFFVYFVGSTTIFLFFLQYVLSKEPPSLKKFPIPVAAFFIVNIFATAFSSHLYTSVWGYYSRFNDGMVSLFIYIGLFYIFINLKNILNIEKLLIIPIITLIPINLFAITQHYFRHIPRVYSTFGNPNWLAVYIIMVLPVVLHFLLTTNEPRQKNFFIAVFLMSYAGLWFTYSLSGLLGLIVSLSVYALINKDTVLKNRKTVGVLFCLMLIFSSLQPGIYKSRINDVFFDLKKVHAQENKQNDTNSNQLSDPGFIRLNVWQGTLNIVMQNPKNFLLGTGPETFPYVFQQHRPQELNYSSEWDFILNKPHNYFLEILSETGISGLASFVAIMYMSLKNRHNYAAASLAGFYTTMFFGFPTVAVALLFWLYIGIAYEK